MKTDLLACRHIGVNKADAEVMPPENWSCFARRTDR